MTMPKVMRELPREIDQFAPRARAKEWSDKVAEARQHVENLEIENARLTEHVTQMKAMLQIAEDKNKELTAQLATVKLEADYHQQRSIEIQTKLKVSAQIILEAMKEPANREQAQERGIDAVQSAMLGPGGQ